MVKWYAKGIYLEQLETKVVSKTENPPWIQKQGILFRNFQNKLTTKMAIVEQKWRVTGYFKGVESSKILSEMTENKIVGY